MTSHVHSAERTAPPAGSKPPEPRLTQRVKRRRVVIGGLSLLIVGVGISVAVSVRPLKDCQRQQSPQLDDYAIVVASILPDADTQYGFGCQFDADPQLTSQMPLGVTLKDAQSRFLQAGWVEDPRQSSTFVSPDGSLRATFGQPGQNAAVEVDVQDAHYRFGKD